MSWPKQTPARRSAQGQKDAAECVNPHHDDMGWTKTDETSDFAVMAPATGS